MTDWTLMKSTPCALSESTAATALAGVVMAMELGKRSLPSGRYPSSMGPEMIMRGPMIRPSTISLRHHDVASTGKPIAEGGVHMHIPKPRNEILTGGIDHPRVLRRLEFCR